MAGQKSEVHCRGLGRRRYTGTVSLVKHIIGNKTMFSRDATECKDLDVLQVFIEMQPDFSAPLELQVDVDIEVMS